MQTEDLNHNIMITLCWLGIIVNLGQIMLHNCDLIVQLVWKNEKTFPEVIKAGGGIGATLALITLSWLSQC